ncbi:hypothetical protein THAOC_23532 [Thalassiosira oceanica]|uniref:Uncharacterized protein n=1 Tax=Thalassiosira oceanica TaxID=159749 RepID=K0RU94_THAOC|nr:hypothetical protein THAOC_23532 [Thalassiosira oceanica]|eukprot:EJK56560.1 hypothetical protein THAOC_23532 [Thalassiosira oceanica]
MYDVDRGAFGPDKPGGEWGDAREHIDGMECARGAAKRQRVSTVESALANIDVLGHLATFLEAGELCQTRATCKALGSRDAPAFDGLSMAEEAARRIFESASDEEKAMLPRHEGEGWIELYHHLLMLRARLTFDQLFGFFVCQEDDKAALQRWSDAGVSSAICGNHVMRAGKHWATFVCDQSLLAGSLSVGVIRPLPGWEDHRVFRVLEEFHPANPILWEVLRRERTSRWEGDVHFCQFYLSGECYYTEWEGFQIQRSYWEGVNDYDAKIDTLGMLLDLNIGTLSVYQNGQRVGILKDGLAGVYCWNVCFVGWGSASMKRGYDTMDA